MSAGANTYRRTAGEEDLTRRLRALRDAGYAIGADDGIDLAAEIIDNIGSPDPELRDELGFSTLAELIVERNVIPEERLCSFLNDHLGDEGINFHLGESGSDSVFRRSFSLLVLALIVAADNRRGLLHVSRDLAGDIVGGLAEMVQRSEVVFTDEEDERIAIALTALRPDDSASALKLWVDGHAPHDGAARINWKNIVRSLYFRTGEGETNARRTLAALQEVLRVHG